ncbi:MAG: response regulator [Alphaproteobacteria bacterium]|nr:response regulator [Alphaproteobacteria bacterium]
MKTCLVIEDSPLVRSIAVRILADLGVESRETGSAAEAVELCREHKPDVVLLDWDLPSMGALDFLRGVGSFAPEARPPIILCATENDQQQFVLAKAAGAAHHLLKPFDKATMREKLAEVGVLDRVESLAGRSGAQLS